MTREEAIGLLSWIRIGNNGQIYLPTWYSEIDKDLEEALDMAIQALSQEPCDDTISRKEFLKAIDTWDKFGVDDTNSLFRLDNLSLPHYVPYIHYDDVIKCIKGMPPVTPSRHVNCEIAEHDGNGCLGYSHYGDDFPIEECLHCPKYTSYEE